MSQPAIEAIRVSKQFGATVAVREVSLQVKPGEFFSLLGPSGCGKTTLLRMIAGFEEPSSGRLVIGGSEMTSVPPHRRPVNLVFQNYALFPHLSVFDNVAFGLRVSRQVAKGDIPARVRGALELVRLTHHSEKFPRQLSGGQQQRVALARALVNNPQVLLLDEPLSALDLKIRQEMQEELSGLQRRLGLTFVMVTHDQGEALALSDRLAVFNRGCLEQAGTPEEVFERPHTAFVAGFLGQTNLLSASVLEKAGAYLKVELAGGLALWVSDSPDAPAAEPGAQVIAWVRTQSLAVLSQETGQSRRETAGGEPVNRLDAVVINASYQGASTQYHLEVNPHLSLRASVPETGAGRFSAGERVCLELPASRASILPVSAAPEEQGQPAVEVAL
ncbi:MAG TPA: ABC transporter ATP-binding protein [Candidatus Obscuribacterales bacterium]